MAGAGYGAFDLDGTLLDADGSLLADLAARIAALPTHGITPVVVTGRSYQGFRQCDLPATVLQALHPAILLDHGNTSTGPDRKRLVRHRTLPPAGADRIHRRPAVDAVLDYATTVVATGPRAALMYAMAYRLPRSEVRVGTGPPDPALGPTSVTVFADRVVVGRLFAGLPHQIRPIGPFAGYVVEPAGTCKAAGLQRQLAQRCGEAGLSRVMAFGDGESDGCLLASAAVGVAMRDSDRWAAECCDLQLLVPLPAFLAGLDRDSFTELLATTGHPGDGNGDVCARRHPPAGP